MTQSATMCCRPCSEPKQTIATESTRRVNTTRVQFASILAIAGAILVGMALWLVKQIMDPMKIAIAAADRLAQGDLSTPLYPVGNEETMRLLSALSTMQGSFGGIVKAVKSNAESAALASAEIAQGNEDLSSRTQSQASELVQAVAVFKLDAHSQPAPAASGPQPNAPSKVAVRSAVPKSVPFKGTARRLEGAASTNA